MRLRSAGDSTPANGDDCRNRVASAPESVIKAAISRQGRFRIACHSVCQSGVSRPPSLAPALKIISGNVQQFGISHNLTCDQRMHRETPHVQPAMIGVRSERGTVDYPLRNGLKALSLPSLPHATHALGGAQGFAAGGDVPGETDGVPSCIYRNMLR
jgi:hypothetical protein